MGGLPISESGGVSIFTYCGRVTFGVTGELGEMDHERARA
jgi:hypothetical protein